MKKFSFNKTGKHSGPHGLGLSLIALLLGVSLFAFAGCEMKLRDDDDGDVTKSTYNQEIKLSDDSDGSGAQSGTASKPGSIVIDPIGFTDSIGQLELDESPVVTDNATAFTNIVAKAELSVVEINTEVATYSWGGQYIQKGAGSGVIISHNSDKSVYYIVTNNHVIDSAQSILVRLSDGTEYASAKLIATDALTDVALVAIATEPGTELQTAVLMNSGSRLADGQDIFVIGNPLGELGGSVTKGIISKTEREINVDGITMQLLQIDASVNPGNSGGALFDMSGNLIGIVNAKYTDESVEGIGFAIPVSTVRNVVQQLAKNGYVSGRPGLGFDTADKSYSSGSIFSSTTTYPTVAEDTNVTGTYTDDDKKTQTFSFEEGDIIISVDEKTVNTTAGLLSLLSGLKIGDNVTLGVCRSVKVVQGGRTYYTTEEYKVTVTLTEYIPSSVK